MPKSVFNSKKTGFILGMVLPVISFLGFYFFRYREIHLVEFFNYIYFRNVLSPLLSLNILPNLILFFLFIMKDYLFSARGVLLATFFYAVIVLILKVVS